MGEIFASVRQRRGEFFLARGFFFVRFECTGSTTWSATVEPEGDIAFGPGDARFKFDSEGITDGFVSMFLEAPIVEVFTLT